MAQQPNIEITEEERPREVLDTAPARPWSPDIKPGVITRPADMPRGGAFGTPGPDTGWALRIIRTLEPQDDSALEAILAALMAARAAALGRAPIPQDLAVAKLFAGLGDAAPNFLSERRERWLAAVPHERAKGRTAVAEVDPDLLIEHPDRIRFALNKRV